MIVRKTEYKVDEAAYLLDLPSRCLIALCDAGVIRCARTVANGEKQQRRKRWISHAEIVRFNESRLAADRSAVDSRLVDPAVVQADLPFPEAIPVKEDTVDYPATPAKPVEIPSTLWKLVVASVHAVQRRLAPPLFVALQERIGEHGEHVSARGLRVVADDPTQTTREMIS